MEDTDVGVFCRGDATFYYMEYGHLATPKSMTVERVLKTLVSRGLITYDTDPTKPKHEQQYQILTVAEAKTKNMKMDPIYISAHVRKTVTEETAKTSAPEKKWVKRNA
jgi:DNA-binding PadR family transcriptional regulator